jgi:hypothetical protein
MVIPPYMSDAIANYYKNNGEEEKYKLQKKSNELSEEIRQQRGQIEPFRVPSNPPVNNWYSKAINFLQGCNVV